jgi:hypothetical protein
VIDGADLPIIGQWGVPFSAGAMCHKQEPSAGNGIASRITANPEATSLKRQVMFLKENATGALSALAVTGITPACNRDYKPSEAAAVSLTGFRWKV